MPKVVDLAQCKSLGGPEGLGGGVDRQAERAVQDAHAAAVVDVVVGNQDGIDRICIPAMLGQPLLDRLPLIPASNRSVTPSAST